MWTSPCISAPALGKEWGFLPQHERGAHIHSLALTIERVILLTGNQHTLHTWFCCIYSPFCEWNLVPTTTPNAESFPTGRRCSELPWPLPGGGWHCYDLCCPPIQWESSLGIGSCSLPAQHHHLLFLPSTKMTISFFFSPFFSIMKCVHELIFRCYTTLTFL